MKHRLFSYGQKFIECDRISIATSPQSSIFNHESDVFRNWMKVDYQETMRKGRFQRRS